MAKLNSGNYLFALAILVMGVVVAGIASYTQASPAQVDPIVATKQSLDQLIEYDQQFVLFYSQIYLDRSKTKISFPFAYPEKTEIMWLGFEPTVETDRFEVLVSHPQLMGLDWSVIQEGNYYLYQRNLEYQDIAEFVVANSDLGRVRIDSKLKSVFPELKDARETDDEFELNDVDFVLTTFTNPTQENGVYYFTTQLNTNSAAVTNENQISWYVTIPAAMEGPVKYLMGNFDINYLQF